MWNISISLFFSALKELPLADATVVFFSSTFILTTMSSLVFKETVVIVGFIGVVIAINPQGNSQLQACFLVLFASFSYAMMFIIGKKLSEKNSIISLIFSLNITTGIIGTIILPLFWVSIPWSLIYIS